MKKKGQVTVFVIVGIVIVVVFALIYFYSSGLLKETRGQSNEQVRLAGIYDEIKSSQIDRCIKTETEDAVKALLEKGGRFEPGNTIRYHGKDVRVLCQAIPGKLTCLSTPLFTTEIESELSERLRGRIGVCIDLSAYRGKDYDIEAGELGANATIKSENIAVDVHYPIKISKGNVKFEKDDFRYVTTIPLGKIIKGVNDVLNAEATEGMFDQLGYGLLSLNRYNIETKKPYPNKIYSVGLSDSDYKLQFAVTGNSRFV